MAGEGFVEGLWLAETVDCHVLNIEYSYSKAVLR